MNELESVEMFCLLEAVEIIAKVSAKYLEWENGLILTHETIFIEYECFFQVDRLEGCMLVIRNRDRKPLTEDFVAKLIPMLEEKKIRSYVVCLGVKIPQNVLDFFNHGKEEEDSKWTVKDLEISISIIFF